MAHEGKTGLSAHQSTQFFWSDWLGDQEVRRLSLAERGLWIDLLALAAVGKPVGYVCDQRGNPLSYEEIARVTNATPTEVESLIAGILEKGAASRDRTGRLFNRRMTRQAEMSAKKRRAGRLGGEHTKLKWQAFQSLPQHLPEHVPRHRDPVPIQSKKEITSASVVEGQGLGSGSLPKRPNEMTRAELEASFAKRRTAP